jgi:hypothetical protein
VVETATAHLEPPSAELVVHCDCGRRRTLNGLSYAAALAVCDEAVRQRRWVGSTQAARGLFLELTGRTNEAYETYDVAGGCSDAFDRAFCHERRAAYELQQGWPRNALHSLRMARAADRRASGARESRYRDAIQSLEQQLTARGIWFAREDTNTRWQRELELEFPPGFNARNEQGQPLSDPVIEVERRLRAEDWDGALAALRALGSYDLVDAIGYASRGVALARSAARLDIAIAIQELVVNAHVIYASCSTSGGEGMARSADVKRERQRLKELQCK